MMMDSGAYDAHPLLKDKLMERPAMLRSLSARLAAHGAGITLVASLAAIAVAAGFMLACQGSSELPVAANPEEREPGWFLPLLEADRQKPRLDGVVNGIRIGPAIVHDWSKVCQGFPGWYVDEKEVRGTPLDLTVRYLPQGTVKEAALATKCGPGEGSLILFEMEFSVPGDKAIGRFGGHLEISRSLVVDTPATNLNLPAERARPITVGGHRAVLIGPITDDGFGPSAVVIAEHGRLTRVVADGITEEELLRIAEGLYP